MIVNCVKCGNAYELNADNFQRDKSKKTGFRPDCKACRKAAYLAATPERRRKSEFAVHGDNKKCIVCLKTKSVTEFGKSKSRTNGIHSTCSDCVNASRRDYREKNKERVDDYSAQWKIRNSEKRKQYVSEYMKERRKDPSIKLKGHISGLVNWHLLKRSGVTKGARFWDAVGYSPSDLIAHIESQFIDGMTWENRGQWEIDHIIPQSKFTFASYGDDQLKACWSLSNIRPLWKIDNIIKSDR